MDAENWRAAPGPVRRERIFNQELAGLLVVAFLLRAALGVLIPNFVHPDEIFQYQEPAHRMLTGHGISTWEFTWRIRSWMVPGLLAPVMGFARLISHDPRVYWYLLTLLMAAASLPSVWVAYRWGSEEQGASGGLIAGAVVALWCELVFFDSHLLMDTVCADLLMPALFARRRFCIDFEPAALRWAGLLFGILVCVRPQFGPAMLLPGVALLRAAMKRRMLRDLVIWTAAPILLWGALDWATLGSPWQSIWRYCWVNLMVFRTNFGINAVRWYGAMLAHSWSWAGLPILFLFVKGARRFELEAVTVMAIMAILMLVQHKEIRFVLPAETLMLALAGVGLARCQASWRGWWSGRWIVLGGTALVSLGLALRQPVGAEIRENHRIMQIANRINHDRGACGIYFASPLGLMFYPGYTLTRDGIALTSDRYDTPAANLKHANYLLTMAARDAAFQAPAGYALEDCLPYRGTGAWCVYHRAGGCDGGGATMPGNSRGEHPQTPIENIMPPGTPEPTAGS